MRIVYVITRADAVGGASIHVRDLARAMLDAGNKASVVVGGAGPVTEQLSAAGVPFRTVEYLGRAIHPWRDLRAVVELTSALRDMQPEIVSTHTAKAGWVGRAACARLGIPAIYTPHGLAVGGRISNAASVIFTLAERSAARWTRAIICVSEAERRLALAKRLASPDRIFVVRNGVRDIPPELRADPGGERLRICSIARMSAPKDHYTLLAALARLRNMDWELELVGNGPREAAIRSRADALGIAARIRFSGYQPDPARALATANLFVLSSRSEAFPRSILEAMRAGLPVVATGVGGVGEAVEEGATGLLAPPGNPDALASAIRKLGEDAPLRLQMGAAARSRYETRFRLERMLEYTQSIYVRVLSSAA